MTDLKFEDALARLEQIVHTLEAGNLPLEESLKDACSSDQLGERPDGSRVLVVTMDMRKVIPLLPGLALSGITTRDLERLDRDLPRQGGPRPVDRETVRRLVPLIRERMQTLAEAAGLVEGFFTDELSYTSDELLGKRFCENADGALSALRSAKERVEALPSWEHEALELTLRALADELSVKAGDLFMLLRVAVTGRPVSPPLFESMEVLGRERCLRRIDEAVERLAQAPA
jgi:glutamyl-tRNA synthetase